MNTRKAIKSARKTRDAKEINRAKWAAKQEDRSSRKGDRNA